MTIDQSSNYDKSNRTESSSHRVLYKKATLLVRNRYEINSNWSGADNAITKSRFRKHKQHLLQYEPIDVCSVIRANPGPEMPA